jgi:hypothetical protein
MVCKILVAAVSVFKAPKKRGNINDEFFVHSEPQEGEKSSGDDLNTHNVNIENIFKILSWSCSSAKLRKGLRFRNGTVILVE